MDRRRYDIHIFYVKDKEKETLILIIKKKYIYICYEIILNNEDENPKFLANQYIQDFI